MRSVAKEGKVILVGVGFALKGDIEVTAHITAILNDAHEPLYQIYDIEEYVAKFLDLRGVYRLMVYHDFIARPLCKEHAAEVDCIETFAERNDFVVDYFHCRNV